MFRRLYLFSLPLRLPVLVMSKKGGSSTSSDYIGVPGLLDLLLSSNKPSGGGK